MLKIELMNAFAQSVALSIMLLYYEQNTSFKRKAGYFILCLILDSFIVMLGIWLNLSLLIHIPVLTLYMNFKIKNLVESLLNVLIVINLFVCSFLLFGSILTLLCNYQIFKSGVLYNLAFCCVTVLSSVFIRFYKNGSILNTKPKTRKSLFIADIFLFTFFLFTILVMPRLPFAADRISYASVQLMVLLFIVFLYSTGKYIIRKEIESDTYRVRNEFLEREMKKYQSLIKLKHFLLRFIGACASCAKEGDTVQFLNVVDDILKPAKEWLSVEAFDIEKLQDIHLPTIKQLVLQLINEVGMLPQIELELDLTAPIHKLIIKEGDLFQVLSILFDNALEEVRGQGKGFLHIQISEDFDNIIITICNSTIKKKEKEKEKLSFGEGLRIVLQTISAYEKVDINIRFTKGECTQQLMIGKR